MYAWIWRHLPFGLPGKLTGSVLMVVGAVSLLWFVVFPWADPFIEETLLPWDDAQLEGDFAPGADTVDPTNPANPTNPADPGVGSGSEGSPEPTPTDPNAIPYDTDG